MNQGRAAGARIVGLGELLWDMLPAGARLGGAPGGSVAGGSAYRRRRADNWLIQPFVTLLACDSR